MFIKPKKKFWTSGIAPYYKASGGGGTTPIALDATGTFATSVPTATSFDFTGLTVGAGLTHSALILCVGFDSQSVTGVTAVWDSGGTPQSMTKIGADVLTPTGRGLSQIWGLINPTAGNKTLHIGTWTTAAQCVVNALSLQNVLQTGGTSSFAPFSATGTSPGSVTVTGASGDFAVAMWTDSAGGGLSLLNNTSLFLDNGAQNIDFASNYAAQTGSIALGVSVGASNSLAAAAVNVVAG